MHGYKWPINCTRTRTAVGRDGKVVQNQEALQQFGQSPRQECEAEATEMAIPIAVFKLICVRADIIGHERINM